MVRRPSDSEIATKRLPRHRTPEAETMKISRFAKKEPERPVNIGEVLGRDLGEDTVVDRYRNLELLGRGGMGEVTRAEDTLIGREVALKTMRVPMGDKPTWASERFLREARVQGQLEHPAIVPVYDISNDSEGQPFFTMKRVRGQTLEDVLSEQRDLSRTQRKGARRHRLLSAFVTVCLAMHYAHERGVVHRDLKPDNIMLGAHGEVHVLDWGVARLITAEPHDAPLDENDTRPGEMVGTPGYMSPEQVLGQLELVDASSDVFALGTILYEILTLEPFFPQQHATEILHATIDANRTPPPPKDCPPELYALCLRATRYDKDDRPQSARELADAVERYLDGDRDRELRQKLADDQAEHARELASLALDGPEANREHNRSQAMREAGRALALFPEHDVARTVVLRLLATPPGAIPDAVQQETTKLRASQGRSFLRDFSFRTISWIVFWPLVLLMGIKSAPVVGAALALVLGCVGFAFWLSRKPSASSEWRLGLFGMTCALGVVLSSIFGPLVFVPGYVAVNTALFGAQCSKRHRAWVLAIGCATIAVPLALELAGVLPPSMSFSTEAVTLLPRATWFTSAPAMIALAAVSFAGVIAPSLVASRLRDALLEADARLLLHKWHIEQLAPTKLSQS
ncbi:MAG: protein kinase [Polyangiaceae bacterium]|nr:protein kinase [Polyangiaceae bacterium]